MRIVRIITNFACLLEEMSRKDDAMGKCVNMMLTMTLADRLWSPFRTIAFSPVMTLIAMLVLYSFFCVIFFPLYILSFAITSYGSFLFVIILFCLGARSLARTMAFPGSTMSFQRELSSDFMRRLSSQLENISTDTANYTATLMLIISGRIPNVETVAMIERLKEIQSMAEILPKIALWLQRSQEILANEPDIAIDDHGQIAQLRRSIEALAGSLYELIPLTRSALAPNDSTTTRQGSTGPKYSAPKSVAITDSKLQSLLLVAAGRCLKASEDLKLSSISIRPKKSEDEGVLVYIKGISKINSGPKGIQKFSFPLMREQIKHNYGAEEIALLGVDGNRIDAIYVPSLSQFYSMMRGRASPGGSRSTSQAARLPAANSGQRSPSWVSKVGTVMFCCPNAGMFECLAQAHRDYSWVGFYTSLGFDVCVFNYRGYCRSGGVPTPDRVKADAEVVHRYLRQQRGVKKLLIHGESIGGMSACHVANKCGAELLVCDRTFASLDAVASRLLGEWAGFGVRRIGLWKTNVVADYLKANCAKVLLQDPNDEVIAYPSSLKIGIATQRVIGDSEWGVRQGDKPTAINTLPRNYAVAQALLQQVPPPELTSAQQLLRVAAQASQPLRDDFIAHLFACLQNVSRRAGQATAATKKRQQRAIEASAALAHSPHSPLMSSRKGAGGASSASAAAANSAENGDGWSQVELSPLQNRGRGSSSADSATQSIGVGGGTIGDISPTSLYSIDAETMEEGGSDAFGPTSSSYQGEDDSSSAAEGEFGEDGDANIGALLGGMGNGGQDRADARAEWLENFCSRSIQDASLSAIEKVWLVLARTDDESGHLLGQAVSKGLEHVRAWICSLIVWSHRSAPDKRMPRSRTTITRSLSDLAPLLHLRELSNDETVTFIRDALTSVAKRATDMSRQTDGSSPHSDVPRLKTDGISGSGAVAAAGTYQAFAGSDSTSAYHDGSQVSAAGLGPTLPGASPSPSSAREASSLLGSGRLIPLHTGHNGWPVSSELDAFKSAIIAAGFPISTEGISQVAPRTEQTR